MGGRARNGAGTVIVAPWCSANETPTAAPVPLGGKASTAVKVRGLNSTLIGQQMTVSSSPANQRGRGSPTEPGYSQGFYKVSFSLTSSLLALRRSELEFMTAL